MAQDPLPTEKLKGLRPQLSTLAALDIAHEAWDHGYSERYILSGFRDCGLVLGQRVNVLTVLNDRAPKLFRKVLSKEAQFLALINCLSFCGKGGRRKMQGNERGQEQYDVPPITLTMKRVRLNMPVGVAMATTTLIKMAVMISR